jgi:cellulose synthase (UDP-forming)
MPSENEMFYGIIQRGLDKWNASFFWAPPRCCSGGAEDDQRPRASASPRMPRPRSSSTQGLGQRLCRQAADRRPPAITFASFIGQRTRWAQGMMQILRFRFPPLKRGLTLPQRLCYMSSTLFWLFAFPRMIFLVSPLFYLFFGAEIFVASGGEFLAYTVMYMIANLMMQNYLYGRFRWPGRRLCGLVTGGLPSCPPCSRCSSNPRNRPSVHGQDGIPSPATFRFRRPFFIIFAVLLAGVVMTVWRWWSTFDADMTLVVGGWNVLPPLCGLRTWRRLSGATPEQPSRADRPALRSSRRQIMRTIEDVSLGSAHPHRPPSGRQDRVGDEAAVASSHQSPTSRSTSCR